LQIKEAMANLFENGQTDLQGKVINAGYNFVLILVQILGVNYVFSVETYPQSDSQETKPPQQTPVAEEDIPYLSNPPTKKEAQAYWTSSIEKNADGTRKGGILGSANFGVNNIFIEDVLHFRVEKNTNKNTVLQINTIEHSNGGLSACCMNVYACQTPSPQAVVASLKAKSIILALSQHKALLLAVVVLLVAIRLYNKLTMLKPKRKEQKQRQHR